MFLWTEESAAFWNDSAAYTKSYDLLAEQAAARLPSGCTVSTAISAALWFGNTNTPVDIQQKAILLTPFSSASSKHDL